MMFRKDQMRNSKFVFVAMAVACTSSVSLAGSVAGFGGATEVTQILNNVQLVQQYEQQVQQFVRQGLQYEAQLKHLQQNPASLLGQDAANLIQGIGGLM